MGGATVSGEVFVDQNGDLVRQPQERGLPGVDVHLVVDKVVKRTVETDDHGTYRFDGVSAGSYTVTVDAPAGYELEQQPAGLTNVPRPREQAQRGPQVRGPSFALRTVPNTPTPTASPTATPTATPKATAKASPTSTPTATPTARSKPSPTAAQQPAAAVTATITPTPTAPPAATDTPTPEPSPTPEEPTLSPEAPPDTAASPAPGDGVLNSDAAAEAALPLTEADAAAFNPARFAPRGELKALQTFQNEDTLWLGIPFKTQIDTSTYALVNCGPASLAMVFAAYGLDVSPADIRAYVNYLSQDYNPDDGTSLDALSTLARVVGLVPLDLYDEHGYRAWTVDLVREHLLRGQPVVTLVKYRDLPGHGTSLSDTDHYIVIGGLYKGDFIYNDAAYSTTDTGYGLLISPENLELAWAASSIPRAAVAIGSVGKELHFSAPPTPSPTPLPTVEPTAVPTVETVPGPPPALLDKAFERQAARQEAATRAAPSSPPATPISAIPIAGALASPPEPAPTVQPGPVGAVPSSQPLNGTPAGLLGAPLLAAFLVALALGSAARGGLWRGWQLVAASSRASRVSWGPFRPRWQWLARLLVDTPAPAIGPKAESELAGSDDPVPACARSPGSG